MDKSIFGQSIEHMFFGQPLDKAFIAMTSVGRATRGGASGSSDPHATRRVSHGGADPSDDPQTLGTPLFDAFSEDAHIPFFLTKLGDTVDVTPEDKRADALLWAHSQGHKGMRGTLHRLLSEGFKWPNMYKDCLKVARDCISCQRFTAQRYGFHPIRAVKASLPMDHLAMDLFQMKTSQEGMSYVLVVVDICTRFTWLYALPDKSGLSVSRALSLLFTTFGKPMIIQSDNGSEFTNLDVAAILQGAGVDQRFVSKYHPQGNGSAERTIRSIKEHLMAEIKGDTSAWPAHLGTVQYSYNTTVHRRHGSTPFSLFFARSHNPWRGEPPATVGSPLTSEQLLARYKLMSDVVFPAVAARTRSYADEVYKGFAKKHKIITEDLPEGALVMRQVKPRGSKMLPGWEGPYVVRRRNRGGAYLLRDSTGDQLIDRIPVSQLRLISYEGSLSPDSFEVETIVSHRGEPGKRKYLVRWKGFSPEHDTWQDEKDIETLRCVVEYWERRRTHTDTPAPALGPMGRTAPTPSGDPIPVSAGHPIPGRKRPRGPQATDRRVAPTPKRHKPRK